MSDGEDTPTIGKRINAIRLYFGDTQAEFAERLGLSSGSQSEVSKWERGEVSVEKARKIAALVDAEFAALEEDDHQFCHGVRFGANAVLRLLEEGPVSAFWDSPSDVDTTPTEPATGPDGGEEEGPGDGEAAGGNGRPPSD